MKKVKFNFYILAVAILVIGGIAIWGWQAGFLKSSADIGGPTYTGERVIVKVTNGPNPASKIKVTLKSTNTGPYETFETSMATGDDGIANFPYVISKKITGSQVKLYTYQAVANPDAQADKNCQRLTSSYSFTPAAISAKPVTIDLALLEEPIPADLNSFKGTVTSSADNKAISGAAISISTDAANFTAAGSTGADGKYQTACQWPVGRMYYIKAEKTQTPAFRSYTQTVKTSVKGVAQPDIDFRLDPAPGAR